MRTDTDKKMIPRIFIVSQRIKHTTFLIRIVLLKSPVLCECIVWKIDSSIRATTLVHPKTTQLIVITVQEIVFSSRSKCV